MNLVWVFGGNPTFRGFIFGSSHIVGTPVEGKDYIIGSCKYRNEKIGVDELDLIRDYASKVTTITTIFSRKVDSQRDFFRHKSEVKFG